MHWSAQPGLVVPDAAVVGIGQTEFSRGSGRSEWELAGEAIAAALDDAGVEVSDVDGLVRSSYDSVDEAAVLRLFPMELGFYGEVGYGGLGAPAVLGHAAAAIAAKQARVVVCYRSLNGYSATRYGRAERSMGDAAAVVARGDRAPSGAFAGPYGVVAPAQIMALWLRRYQTDYGVGDEQLLSALGRIAVEQRAYANRNPAAVMNGKQLTAEDYRAARRIYEPLGLYDLALETDGAVAMVVVADDLVAGRPHPPAWISGSVQGLYRFAESISVYGPLRNSAQYRASAERLYRQAGCSPGEVSVASLYDATTVTVLLSLETWGFAEEGQAWRYLLDHGIGPDSPLPANTSGGHLSEAYVHYFSMMAEAVRQCQGRSTSQVGTVRNVLCCSGSSGVMLSTTRPR